MTTLQQLLEESEKEFEKLTPDPYDTGAIDSLYEKNGYRDWLQSNKHLYHEDVYGEPMFDISKDKVLNWHKKQMERAYQLGMEDAFKIATEKIEKITMAFSPKM